MKKLLISIIPILSLVSCFNSFDQTIEYRIEPTLEKHVNQFFDEAESRGLVLYKENLIISYNEDINAAGYSFKQGDQRIIFIKKSVINHFKSTRENPNWAIENLMFHELGHSILFRKHCDPKYSIMELGMSFYEYENDSTKRVLLVNELFTLHR